MCRRKSRRARARHVANGEPARGREFSLLHRCRSYPYILSRILAVIDAWSLDARALVRPARTFQALAAAENAGNTRSTFWTAARRPLFLCLVLGCVISLIGASVAHAPQRSDGITGRSFPSSKSSRSPSSSGGGEVRGLCTARRCSLWVCRLTCSCYERSCTVVARRVMVVLTLPDDLAGFVPEVGVLDGAPAQCGAKTPKRDWQRGAFSGHCLMPKILDLAVPTDADRRHSGIVESVAEVISERLGSQACASRPAAIAAEDRTTATIRRRVIAAITRWPAIHVIAFLDAVNAFVHWHRARGAASRP